MNGSESQAELSASLVAALSDLRNPTKDSKGQVRGNPNYRYLSLPALCEHVRAAFGGTGLAFSQEVVSDAGGVGVITRIVHSSGEWLESGPLTLPAVGSPQDIGSAITYARRYALAAVVGLAADEDDDGKKASDAANPPRPRRRAGSEAEPTSEPAATSAGGDPEELFGKAAPREAPTPAPPVSSGGDIPALLKAIGWTPNKALTFARNHGITNALGGTITNTKWDELPPDQAERLGALLRGAAT